MQMTLATVAASGGGALTPAAAAAVVATGAAIDSRRLRRGDLFFALAGARADGHQYVAAALRGGAVGAVVARRQDTVLPQIVSPDPQQALMAVAAAWRRQLSAAVVAVTGSNGKTTVKEMLAQICRAAYHDEAVHCSQGNYNNHLGVPLTLLAAKKEHQVIVAEAGMDAAGEITQLGALLRPHVAVINNAQRAHIGNFSSVADIARAKGELLPCLRENGTAVLCADSPYFSLWRRLATGRNILSFGFSATATVRGKAVAGGLRLGDRFIRLRVPGRHNQHNALAAAAAARALGLSTDAVCRGLEAYAGFRGRLSVSPLAGGSVLIDDSYNANPESAMAALAVLQQTAASIAALPLLVMGDMLALGDAESAHAHAELVAACTAARVRVFGFGEAMQAAGGDIHFSTKKEIVTAVRRLLEKEKVCVLVKGSRGMGMEEVAQALTSASAAGGEE